ncbi:hypothetical protein IBX73_03030 [candidate division WOR-3 bacterium]|nr:hypothetical protein [candidate division WOR-3 bacterium]
MAVLPVEKIQIVVHKSTKDEFLQELQREGIVHIAEMEETTAQTPALLGRLQDGLNQLAAYRKRHPLSMFFNMKRTMSYDAFVDSARSFDHAAVVARLEGIKTEREALSTHSRSLQDDIALLNPWKPFASDLESLREFKQTDSFAVMIPSPETMEKLAEEIAEIPHSVENVNAIGAARYSIFYVKKEHSGQLRARLVENGCETTDFRSLTGTPAAAIARFGRELKEAADKMEALNEAEKDLAENIRLLEATTDLLVISQKKSEVAAALPETMRTANITGWILKRNLARLDRLVQKFSLVFYEKIEKEPGERPPVALQNITPNRPYEMLIKLYSMPDPREYDPTPFLAFFFPIMFGLCITDAIYGILLIIISLYLMRSVTGDKSLFKILLVGGILTIFAGAMVGGWAGDLFEYIGYEPLIRFKNTFMLFDPIKNPMIFIALALGIGFIHMMLGIAIEIVDNLRNGEYGQAIFANLTWFIILPSIILYFSIFGSSPGAKGVLEIALWICLMGIIVASHPEGKSSPLDQSIWAIIIWILWYFGTSKVGELHQFSYVIRLPNHVLFALLPLVAIEIFRFKYAKQVLGKIAWGFYNVYGISNYLGVLLSYVRLMALGMVTGVIAIAINKIAWMVMGIPVLGVFLVIIVLIPSHLFNLIINTLGGFIHTMRLQYIEFFGRFYSGGSKPFKPFRLETDYVEIK